MSAGLASGGLLTRWPARFSVPLLLMLVCAIALVGLYVFRLQHERADADAELRSRLNEIVGLSARRIDSYGELGDSYGASGIVTRLALYDAIVEAWLLDADGRVLFSLRRGDTGKHLLALRERLPAPMATLLEALPSLQPDERYRDQRSGLMLLVEPALIRSAPLERGRLVVLADGALAAAQARWQVRRVFRTELLVLISAAVLLWWLLRRQLLERSARLLAAAESLRGGEIPLNSGVLGEDELGAIGAALDAGFHRLRRHEALQRLAVDSSRLLSDAAPLPDRLKRICALLVDCGGCDAARVLSRASPESIAGVLASANPGDAEFTPQATLRYLLQSANAGDDVPAALELLPAEAAAADADWRAAFDMLAQDLRQEIGRVAAERARQRAERRERLALDAAEVGAWQFDLAQARLRLYSRAAAMLGVEPETEQARTRAADEPLELTLEQLAARLHPIDADRLRERLSADTGCPSRLDEEFRARRGGEHAWLLARGTVTERGEDGVPQALAGVLIDIDARKRADSALRLAGEVFDSSQLGILICDADDRIIDVNPAFESITGYRRDEVLGQRPSLLSSGRHAPAFFAQLWKQLDESGRWQGEIWNRRRDGSVYPQWLTITRVDDSQGQPLHYIGQFVDTSDRKAIESRIEYLGAHDLLTGLPRRERLLDALAAELAGPAPSLMLMHVDIDRFRQINESLGYEAGDRLLRAVADRIGDGLPPEAWVSRISADEFLVLVAVIDAADAEGRASALQRRLCQPIEIAGQELVLGISLGYALGPRDAGSAAELAAAAERALIAAQQAGRNTIQAYSPVLHGHSLEALTLESQLRQALNRGEFFVVYQAQVDLRSGQLAGYEALVRWRHPTRGLVSPAEFIPLAESTGLIVPLGEFVLREACAATLRLRQRGLPAVPVSVNVSALQFRREDFESTVASALADSGLPAELLELELTESVLMDQAESALQRLDRLRGRGLKLAIDDFGTGFSSLAYLGRLKPDRLKIDQSFVRGMSQSATSQGVVKAILALAAEFELATVAEGVESQEEAAVLRALGCDVGQGYLFARPVEEDALRWPPQ